MQKTDMLNKIISSVFIFLSAFSLCADQKSMALAAVPFPNESVINNKIKSLKDSNNLPQQAKEKTIFNYDPNYDLILLPVIYKDERLLFVLDTGFTLTAFDTSFAKELGNPKKMLRGTTAGGKTVLPVYNAPDAYLGPYNLKDYNEILCTDMRMLSFVAGEKIS